MIDLKTSAYGRRVLEQSPLFAQMDDNSRSDLIGQGWKREGWQTDREGGGYKHGQVIGFHEV